MSERTVQEVTWPEVRELVSDGDLRDLLSAMIGERAEQFKVFRARYRYGELIVDGGQLQLPDGVENEIVEQVRKETSYSAIPLCLVTKGSAEVYTTVQDTVCPKRVVGKGQVFGLFELMDCFQTKGGDDEKAAPWSVSSGARTVHLIAPVNSEGFVKAINKRVPGNKSEFHITVKMKWHEDQWNLLRDLADKLVSLEEWHTEILIFPRWSVDEDSEAALRTKMYLSVQAWHDSTHLRNSPIHQEEIIRALSDDLQTALGTTTNEWKNPVYCVEVLRQLMGLASGFAVAFRRVEDDCCGPFSWLEKVLWSALQDVPHVVRDGKKPPYPVILEPCELVGQQTWGYYSFSRPTEPLLRKDDKDIMSVVELMREIEALVLITQEKSEKGSFLRGFVINKLFSYKGDRPNVEDFVPQDFRDRASVFDRHRFFVGAIRIELT